MKIQDIKTVMVTINGKKVPLMKIPAGVSGISPEAKAEIELKLKNKEILEESNEEIDLDLRDRVEKYYNTGDCDGDSQVEDYLNYKNSSVQRLEIEDYFDKHY